MILKNSNEYLTAETRSKLMPKDLEIIDAIQCGSPKILRQKVNETALQLMIERQKNPNLGKKVPWYKKWWGALIAISGGIVILASGINAILELIRWIKLLMIEMPSSAL